MDTPNRSYWQTAPHSVLRNVSNGQSASPCCSSSFDLSSFDQSKTPTKESQEVLSASAKRIKSSIRRELSKSHGNLSNLRPKTPPLAGLHRLHLSQGNYVDDTQNLFSPSYNRLARQAIPNDWMTGASGSKPSTTTEGSTSAGRLNYQSPLYGRYDSHHVEAETSGISIQGLTSGYIQPLDFCVPVTRSHPGDEDQRRDALKGDGGRSLAVEHIDISTAWNGLSHVDAKELFRVHRAFVSTLERMLANELWQIYQQLQQQDFAGNIRPIHTLYSAGMIRGISFCRDQLVSEMVETLYSSKEDKKTKAKSGFLRLYLIANDALLQYHGDGSRDTSITIRVRCDPLSLRPHPIVEAAWVPDSLMFEGLDECPLEGQSFSIVPRYYSKSAFRPTRFPKNVKYSIESESRHPLSWLVWDDGIAGFKGIVPFYSEVNGYDRDLTKICQDPCDSISNTLKIIVQAVLVDENGSSIRYERILRTRLTLKVVPWYANDNSRESKKRSSVPKAYQDSRLASAAQCFALQGPGVSPLKSEQSPSRPSQRSEGANLHTPSEYVHIGQVGFEDSHSAISSSATRVGLKETDFPSLAQTQACLVAKCVELIREVENIKEQVMMSAPFGEHHNRTLHITDPQEYLYETYRVPFYHHTGQNGPTSGSSVPCVSHHAWEHSTTPSPTLHGRDTTCQLGSNANSSVLPPPAIGVTTRSMLDPQPLNDGNASDVTRIGWDPNPGPSTTPQFLAPEEILLTRNTHSIRDPRHYWHLPEQVSTSLNDTDTAQCFPRRRSQAVATPPIVEGELVGLSTSGKRGHKRRARSSLNEISSKKTAKQPKRDIGTSSAEPGRNTLPLSDPEDHESSTPTQRASGTFYNYFGPLGDLRSSPSLAGEDAQALHTSERETPTNSSENIKHHNHNSSCYTDGGNTDSDESACKKPHSKSGLSDGETTAEGVPSNALFQAWKGLVRRREISSASFSPRDASASSSKCSHSTSSEMEFVIEQDPSARKLSRQEQAKLWKLLSQSDRCNENQPGSEGKEVRLSEDEKKAMDEAVQRSLDDLAGGFDDIFLEDSSESNSGDDLRDT